MASEGLLLFERIESSVVLPAPDGPIIANISPGWQYPSQLSSKIFSLA